MSFKRIILIRHAKVNIDKAKKINAQALKMWVDTYDTAPIYEDSLPSEDTIHLAQNADRILTSTLKRAIDSASMLGVSVQGSYSVFNEATIPTVNIPLLKLKPKTWLVILRVLLLLGLGKKDTSLKASKEQAKEAAKKLMRFSQEYASVVLVGHGGMNWLISKVLEKEGWELEGKRSYENWGVSVLKIESRKVRKQV